MTFGILWLPEKISRRFTLIVSAIICAAGLVLAGPSQILNLPESLILIGSGLAIAGASAVGMIVPCLSEMNDVGKRMFIGQEENVVFYASGLFNSFLAGGALIGPLFGSMAMNAIGFRLTTDVLAIICLLFAITYIFIGEGLEAFKSTMAAISKNEIENKNQSEDSTNSSQVKLLKLESDFS